MIFGVHPYNNYIPDKIDLLRLISLLTAIAKTADNINAFSAYIITLKLTTL